MGSPNPPSYNKFTASNNAITIITVNQNIPWANDNAQGESTSDDNGELPVDTDENNDEKGEDESDDEEDKEERSQEKRDVLRQK